MFNTLTLQEKEALARVGLGIFGILTDGRIRTNEPHIYDLFVDLFGVSSQVEIIPILQRVMRLDQSSATAIASRLTNEEKNEFRLYMLSKANNDHRLTIPIGIFMVNIGFKMESGNTASNSSARDDNTSSKDENKGFWSKLKGLFD